VTRVEFRMPEPVDRKEVYKEKIKRTPEGNRSSKARPGQGGFGTCRAGVGEPKTLQEEEANERRQEKKRDGT